MNMETDFGCTNNHVKRHWLVDQERYRSMRGYNRSNPLFVLATDRLCRNNLTRGLRLPI